MHFNLLTLFPDMFPGSLGLSLSKRAFDNKTWSYDAINIRDHAHDKHTTVDDTPYGGGAGMVMKPDILENALLSIPETKHGKLVYMSPRGRVLDQSLVQELTQESHVTLLCGRYEGVDQRFLDAYNVEEISIGDYVLSGGEPAAIILMDACIRLLDGVMGNVDTAGEESFSNGLLEYPHYTKPASWTDSNIKTHDVPEILRAGNHAKINEWRHEQSLKLTKQRRPDLLNKNKEKDQNIEGIITEIIDEALDLL
jgi:tRNA (guanine37-N1)-methyltransferase